MSYILSFALCTMLATCGMTDVNISETVEAATDNNKKAHAVLQDDRIDQTYSLNFDGVVKASNINGSIKVTTWDSPQVRLIAVKKSSDPSLLRYVDFKVDSDASSFSVKAEYDKEMNNLERDRRNFGDLKVEFELTVPRTARLDSISTVNGDVSIDGASGTTEASTVNGTVRATGLSGEAKLMTVNGSVEADFDQLAQAGDIKLTTVNGKVNLTLPSDANATIRANSLSGSITNDFGLPVRKGEYVGRDLHGRIGTGDVKIKMTSVSGSLTVTRKNDGRQANPATNLLDMKADSDGYSDSY